MSNPLKFFQRTWQVVATACSPLREEPAPTVSLTALEDRVLYDASPLAGLVIDVDQSIDTLEDIDGHINDLFLEESTGTEVSFGLHLSADDMSDQQLLEPARQLLVIDERVDDIDDLFKDILENSHARSTFDIVRINDESSGIEQISDVLSSGAEYSAVHIVSHGSEASLQLGSLELNQDNIGAHTAELSGWASGLTLDADILLYGCDVAGNVDGEFFVEQLSSITGADVAASDDLTGHADLGGDWEFEYFAGEVQTDVAFSYTTQATWREVLETITVTTNLDENNGDTSSITALRNSSGGDGISLREAIIAANNTAGDDTIVLAAGTYDLTIAGTGAAAGDLNIESTITIQGAGAQQTSIAGAASGFDSRLFSVFNGANLTLQGMTVEGGSVSSGAAVFVFSEGSLEATDVVFRDNHSNLSAGAIFASGNVTLNRVALINNTSGDEAGAIRVSGNTTLTNVTLSGNTAGDDGGAIYVFGGTLDIDHSTIADNETTGGSGGGIFVNSGTVTISNSIVADNFSSSGDNDVSGTINSGGFNIIEDDAGLIVTPGDDSANDITGEDPELDALALIDGTFVHAFARTSIAYNEATGSTKTEDQRGFDRDSSPDIGAYELQVAIANQVVPGPQTIDEDTTLTFVAGTPTEVSVSDSLSSTDAIVRVTLSVDNGVLTLFQTVGLTFIDGADGSSRLVIEGTESDLNAALDGLTFTPDADFNGSVTLDMETTVEPGLEANYSFEGGNIDDGVLIGDAAIIPDPDTNSGRGDVLSLDGDRDYVEVEGLYGEPSSITLAAFINPVLGDNQEVISLGDNVAIRVRDDGELAGFYYDSDGIQTILSGTTVTSGWSHVALTLDDDGAGTITFNLYIDGVEVGSNTHTGSIDYTRGSNTTIGAHGDGNINFDYEGLIDDVRVYSSALSAAEISDLANEPTGSSDQSTVNDSVAITVTAVNDAPAIAQLSDDAVAAYDFEDGTDSIASGGPVISVSSPVTISDADGYTTGSSGLLFPTGDNDSSTNPVSIGTIPGVGTSDKFSFSAAVRFDAGDGDRLGETIFAFGDDAGKDSITLSRSGTTNDLTLEVWSGTTIQGNLTISDALAGIEGEWHHYGVTIDASGNARIFIDGVNVGSMNFAAIPDYTTWDENYIGTSLWSVDQRFQGAIDDIGIFDRALTASEMASLANTSTPQGFTVDENAADTTSVGIVHGGDVDGDTLTYSIQSQEHAGCLHDRREHGRDHRR